MNLKLTTFIPFLLLLASCGSSESDSPVENVDNEDAVDTEVSAPEYSTWTDSRDGRTYKTIVINGKEWFAENLDYATASSQCYDGQCEKYGRCYSMSDWSTAVPSDEGWRVPLYEDIQSLLGTTQGCWTDRPNPSDLYCKYHGPEFMSSSTVVDENNKARDNLNTTGFSAPVHGLYYLTTDVIGVAPKWKAQGLSMWTQAAFSNNKMIVLSFQEDGKGPGMGSTASDLNVVRLGRSVEEEKLCYRSLRLVRDI